MYNKFMLIIKVTYSVGHKEFLNNQQTRSILTTKAQQKTLLNHLNSKPPTDTIFTPPTIRNGFLFKF